MISGDGSMPVTSAPMRASGSDTSPAPQPTSRIRKPFKALGRSRFASEMAGDLVADIAEPHRVEPVERGHRALSRPTIPRPAPRNARPRRHRRWSRRPPIAEPCLSHFPARLGEDLPPRAVAERVGQGSYHRRPARAPCRRRPWRRAPGRARAAAGRRLQGDSPRRRRPSSRAPGGRRTSPRHFRATRRRGGRSSGTSRRGRRNDRGRGTPRRSSGRAPAPLAAGSMCRACQTSGRSAQANCRTAAW